MKIKKILASVLGLALTASVFAGCSSGSGTSGSSGSGSGSASGDLIKVGIINNDPNESGYRTANDKDMKATFTEENGYDASFAYSLKNDEQIAAADIHSVRGGLPADLRRWYFRLGFSTQGRSGSGNQGYPVRQNHRR